MIEIKIVEHIPITLYKLSKGNPIAPSFMYADIGELEQLHKKIGEILVEENNIKKLISDLTKDSTTARVAPTVEKGSV